MKCRSSITVLDSTLSLFLRMWRSTRCSLMTMSSSSMSLARCGRLISVPMLAACLPLPSSLSLIFACRQSGRLKSLLPGQRQWRSAPRVEAASDKARTRMNK